MLIIMDDKILLPTDVGIQVFARIEQDSEIGDDVEFLYILGLSGEDLKSVRTSHHFKRLKLSLLMRNLNLLNLFEGGHGNRVKKYNKLVKRLILRSPVRFKSLTAPYESHKFLPEDTSDDETREPAYYYPIDGPSVDFWNRVYETERMLNRFKVATLWRDREERILNDNTVHLANHQQHECIVAENISGLAFKMEHQFAKVLLLQNLHLEKLK